MAGSESQNDSLMGPSRERGEEKGREERGFMGELTSVQEKGAHKPGRERRIGKNGGSEIGWEEEFITPVRDLRKRGCYFI